MYGLIGKISAVAGSRDKLAGIMAEGMPAMDGCISYVIAVDEADPDGIWITEVWTSKAAHAASLSNPAVGELIGKARPLIAGMGPRHETTPLGGIGLS